VLATLARMGSDSPIVARLNGRAPEQVINKQNMMARDNAKGATALAGTPNIFPLIRFFLVFYA